MTLHDWIPLLRCQRRRRLAGLTGLAVVAGAAISIALLMPVAHWIFGVIDQPLSSEPGTTPKASRALQRSSTNHFSNVPTTSAEERRATASHDPVVPKTATQTVYGAGLPTEVLRAQAQPRDTSSYRQILHPETGALHQEEWRNAVGELHRRGGPAVTGYRADGSVSYERYYRNGMLHSASGSAVTGYRSDGSVFFQEYYVGGQRHRERGPAAIGRRSDGSVFYEAWYSHDLLHRSDGPALLWRSSDSGVPYEAYFAGGVLHRTDGPAVLWYTEHGAVDRVQYFVHGEERRARFDLYVVNPR